MVLCFCCKQKTAYEMRISDWSSDVCSSDLAADDRELLPVLFAKDRDVGADLVEQLGDDGRDPVEMAGTRGAAIIGAQLGDFDAAAVPRGIHDRDVGRPQQRYLFLDQQRRVARLVAWLRSEEHTSELQSLMRISYAVFCLQNKKQNKYHIQH